MTKDEALKLALEALELHGKQYPHMVKGYCVDAIAAIKEALAMAQPEQEPLEYWNAVEGWVKIDEVRQHFETVSCGTIYKTAGEGRVPLYTAPPKREPLTDGEIQAVIDKTPHYDEYGRLDLCGDVNWFDLARAIEAKLKEKNQ